MIPPSNETNINLGTILVDHYQRTFELTLEMWKLRNRTFLYLLGTIGLASLLTLRIPEANSLLVDAIAGLLNITDSDRIDDLRNSFPFAIIGTILLIVVFYLMVNLYHRSHYVLRNYQYLNGLEREIRQHLGLFEGIAFTREGDFYWDKRPKALQLVKFIYIGIIGSLLVIFYYGRFFNNPNETPAILTLLEFGIAIATLIFYFAYMATSLGLDKAKKEVPTKG